MGDLSAELSCAVPRRRCKFQKGNNMSGGKDMGTSYIRQQRNLSHLTPAWRDLYHPSRGTQDPFAPPELNGDQGQSSDTKIEAMPFVKLTVQASTKARGASM